MRIDRVIAVLQSAVIAFIVGCCLIFGWVYVGLYLDDTCYHVPAAVRIAQHLNPYFVDSPVDSHWFPAGAETLVAVLVFLTGSLNVTNLSGSACVVALVILMYRFAALWCRDTVGRLATVACVSTIPLMIGQSLAFYVDIHLALVVCTSLFFQCLALLRRQARYAYYGLAVALLAPSIKYSGLLMLPVLVPTCILCIRHAPPPRLPSTRLLLLLLATTLFTSGWYVRNWLYRGNPIYPLDVPAWTRPLLAIAGAPYEFDPEHRNISPGTEFPHPIVPAAWIEHEFSPDMTDDAFGASFVLAGMCVLLSLVFIRRQTTDQRNAWLFLLTVVVVLVVTFPYRLEVPRYLLFVPILASLGPAVLYGVARRGAERHAADLLCIATLLFSGTYAFANLAAAAGPVPHSLRVASAHLVPYHPVGIRTYPYVQRGHLRIGYLSGYRNFIALLYDPQLTNTLIPLHYENYPYNWWHEMASPEEFVRHVESLHLDFIHVFDPAYPGVGILRAHFPEKIMPEEMRGR